MSKHNGIIEDEVEEDNNSKVPQNLDSLSIINEIIKTIAQILEDLIIDNNDNEIVNSDELIEGPLKVFFMKKQPNKPILDYFQRLIRYARPEPSSVIISLIYIDKVCENTDLQLSFLNIHRLILASLVIAIKYNEDGFYSNTYYAKVGGISCCELNGLEYEMLQALEFMTFIDEVTYFKYAQQLSQSDEKSD